MASVETAPKLGPDRVTAPPEPPPAGAPGVRYAAEGIRKSFSGAEVLHGIDVVFEPGEIHTLVGENGAGKSTLLKIMAGVYSADAGTLHFGAEPLAGLNPRSALQRGVYLVPQEPTLLPHLSAGENLYLGILPGGRLPLTVGWRRLRRRAVEHLREVGLEIDPGTRAEDLSIAQQQLLECARALAHGCGVIFFDEPTSPLTEHEADVLFGVMSRLRDSGHTLAFISHRLDEVLRISDRITVLRDGAVVARETRATARRDELVRAMVGRTIERVVRHRRRPAPGRTLLEVRGLTLEPSFADVDLTVRAGEVVGLAGLVGSGRTEIAETIFGLRTPSRGEVVLDGRPFEVRSPHACIEAGLVYLSEDRGRHGIFADVPLAQNVTTAVLPRLPRRFGLLRLGDEYGLAAAGVERTNVHAPSLGASIKTLSGGNQQRAMLGRWLLAEPKVAILDEPTRGVDVGAKADIYDIVDQLADDGVGILLISSEIEELTRLCDRIVVAYEGRIVGALAGEEIDEPRLGALVVGEQEH
jgi:ABC-type sugar transport system ATPase subunit